MTQTFGDEALEREILDLFVAQAAMIVRDLPTLPHQQQGDLAHRLNGSARGIGAWTLAAAAATYEQSGAASRAAAFTALKAAIEAALAAIAGHRR